MLFVPTLTADSRVPAILVIPVMVSYVLMTMNALMMYAMKMQRVRTLMVHLIALVILVMSVMVSVANVNQVKHLIILT